MFFRKYILYLGSFMFWFVQPWKFVTVESGKRNQICTKNGILINWLHLGILGVNNCYEGNAVTFKKKLRLKGQSLNLTTLVKTCTCVPISPPRCVSSKVLMVKKIWGKGWGYTIYENLSLKGHNITIYGKRCSFWAITPSKYPSIRVCQSRVLEEFSSFLRTFVVFHHRHREEVAGQAKLVCRTLDEWAPKLINWDELKDGDWQWWINMKPFIVCYI